MDTSLKIWDDTAYFDSIMKKREPEKEPEPNRCVYGRQFYEWCQLILSRVAHPRSPAELNQAMLSVTKKYREWYKIADRKHQDYTGKNHVCILQVWKDAMTALEAALLILEPEPLYLPAPPKPPRKKKEPVVEVNPFTSILVMGSEPDYDDEEDF